MMYFQRRLLRTYSDTAWSTLADGSYTAQVDDFRLTLTPKSRGRWVVVVKHADEYSPPFPRWQASVEAAKWMAYLTLDDAQDWVHEYARTAENSPLNAKETPGKAGKAYGKAHLHRPVFSQSTRIDGYPLFRRARHKHAIYLSQ
ncbi:hypothetical protein QCL51_17875 [Pseudomonas sp. LTR0]|uniref:hypothetical protein n=1 Tax=Pseudomonas sp. LTR0 TaxID=3040601 RepID=UPI0030D16DDC